MAIGQTRLGTTTGHLINQVVPQWPLVRRASLRPLPPPAPPAPTNGHWRSDPSLTQLVLPNGHSLVTQPGSPPPMAIGQIWLERPPAPHSARSSSSSPKAIFYGSYLMA